MIARVADGARRETCPRKLVMDYMDLAGLKVSERCTKPRAPTTECGPCGRLFRAINMVRGVARVRRTEQTNHGMSTHAVKKALDDCWDSIGCDTSQFSGKSIRRGGLHVAMSAGVSESL